MKGVFSRIHAVLFIFIFSVSFVYAADRSSDSGTIIVTGTVEPVAIEEYGGTVTVITAEEIAEKNPANVKELLSSIPSLAVTSTGVNDVSVGIRGAATGHTLFMVDGVTYSDPSGMGGFDLWMIDPSVIERIEIISGPVSAMYGSGAMAGVINIITKKEINGGTVGIYGGNYDTFELSAGYGMKYLQLNASYHREGGFSATTDDNEEDRFWTGSFYAKHRFEKSNYSHSFSGMYSRSMYEYDYPTDSDAYQTTYQLAFSPSYKVNEYWTPALNLAYTKSIRDTYQSGTHNEFEGDSISVQLNNNIKLSDKIVFNAGGKWGKDTGNVWENTPPYSLLSDKSMTVAEGFINATFKPLKDWSIFAGGRYSDVSGETSDVSKFTYSMNTSYNIDALNLVLKGSYGTGFKSPSLAMLYDPAYGNLSLKAEKSKVWELGFVHSVKDNMFVWGVTYFDAVYDDKITYNGTNFDNTDRDSNGVEVFIELYVSIFALNASYTYAHISEEKAGNSEQVYRRPSNQASLALTAYPLDGLSLKLEGVYTGEADDIYYVGWTPHQTVNDAYFLLNFYASYDINDSFKVYGKILNMADKDYVIASGYNTKGINFLLGANYKF